MQVCFGQISWAKNKPPKRAVAVLYDDSGSMLKNSRWVYANSALQTMTALLEDDDMLFLARMNADVEKNGYNIKTVRVNQANIKTLLNTFLTSYARPKDRQSTRFDANWFLLEKLKQTDAKEKWLLVVTDAQYPIDNEKVRQQEETIATEYANQRINVQFILIQPEPNAENSDQIAGFWQKHVNASIKKADEVEQLPAILENIASELVGRDKSGLDYHQSKDSITIESVFPLKGMVILIQNEQQNLAIQSANIGQQGNPSQRLHRIQSPKNHQSIKDNSYVAHVTAKNAVSNDDKTATVRFDKAISPDAKIKVFPTIAANLVIDVYSQGKLITPTANGTYNICMPHDVELRASLVTENGQILTGDDIINDKLDIRFKRKGLLNSDIKTQHAPQQHYHHVDIAHNDLNKPLSITPVAKYPGYFDIKQPAMTLKSVPCHRHIAIKLLSGADDKQWHYPVNALDTAPPLVFSVDIDGQPATTAQMQGLSLPLPDKHPWTINQQHNQFVLTAKHTFCALCFIRPQPIEKQPWHIDHLSDSPYDQLDAPIDLSYAVTYPANKNAYYWWRYGCPISFWLGIILLLWYLKRIFSKSRFAPKACIHRIRKGMNRSRMEPLVKSRHFISRWLWPSRQETRVIDGITFAAIGSRGNSIKVLGKCLNESFEINGWVFDEVRKESGKAQLDGILYDKNTLYHYDKSGDVDYRMQYGINRSRPVWDDDIFN